MRLGEHIFNLDGLPFRNETTAQRLKDLLTCESGKQYRLENYPEGGFVLVDVIDHHIETKSTSALCETHAYQNYNSAPLSQSSKHEIETTSEPSQPTSKPINLRPAIVRTNLNGLLLMSFAVILALFPDTLLNAGLSVSGISNHYLGGWYERVIALMGTLGAMVVAVIWILLMWRRSSALYRVTEFGVEARFGIIAQESVGLRFQDIRSTNIKQSVIDRLLNVGLLEFTSAGTDGVPVQFKNIARPGKVLELVRSRMAKASSAD